MATMIKKALYIGIEIVHTIMKFPENIFYINGYLKVVAVQGIQIGKRGDWRHFYFGLKTSLEL